MRRERAKYLPGNKPKICVLSSVKGSPRTCKYLGEPLRLSFDEPWFSCHFFSGVTSSGGGGVDICVDKREGFWNVGTMPDCIWCFELRYTRTWFVVLFLLIADSTSSTVANFTNALCVDAFRSLRIIRMSSIKISAMGIYQCQNLFFFCLFNSTWI